MGLFSTISEFKEYIAIDANTKLATLAPYIAEAEQLYLKPLLGPEFYDELVALDEGAMGEVPVPLTDEISELMPYVRRCLAYYTLLQAIPHLSSTFGELGIRQHRGEDSDTAPRWKEEKLQFHALKNGDIHADLLLAFLEDHQEVTDYGTWAESEYNSANSGFIVYNTAIASRHIDINGSRRVFLKLRPKMREIEKRMIPKLISKEQYEELVEQLEDADPEAITEANAALIEKIEPIICKRALYMVLPFMRVQLNENGIFIYSGTDDLFKLGQLASDADIKILRAQLMDEKEFGYLADEAELRQFILDNIADYPLIAASTVYTTQPDPGPTWESQNDPDNKFFSV